MITEELKNLEGIEFLEAEQMEGMKKEDAKEGQFYLTCRVRNCLEGFDFRLFKRVGDKVVNAITNESVLEEYGLTIFEYLESSKENIDRKLYQ